MSFIVFIIMQYLNSSRLLLLFAGIICYCNSDCLGYNILFLSPVTCQSRTNFIKPIVKALAERNHSVTYWNGLKPDKTLMATPNLRTFYSERVGQVLEWFFNQHNNFGNGYEIN